MTNYEQWQLEKYGYFIKTNQPGVDDKDRAAAEWTDKQAEIQLHDQVAQLYDTTFHRY